MEIERKWLLPHLPSDAPVHSQTAIFQAYVAEHPGVVLRIRRTATRRDGEQFTLTAKGAGLRARNEWEVKIPEWLFEELWGISTDAIMKSRRVTETGEEIDVFAGELDGLVLMEREFPTTEDAEVYVLPAWAQGAIEVTDNREYQNVHLGKLSGEAAQVFLRSSQNLFTKQQIGRAVRWAVARPPSEFEMF